MPDGDPKTRRTVGSGEAADLLGVGRRRVLQLITDGVLDGDKEANRWRITASSVQAELARRQASDDGHPPAEDAAERGDGADGPQDDPDAPSGDGGSGSQGPPWWASIPPLGRIRNEIRFRRHVREMEEYYADRDPDINEKTSPPDDEQVRVRSIWVVEAYAPRTVDQLLDGIDRLGWDQQGYYGSATPSDWVRNSRGSPWVGGRYPLNHIVPPGRPWLPSGFRAPLPEGVRSIYGSLHSVGPSTTLFVAQFILKRDLGLRSDAALRRTYKSRTEKTPTGTWATKSPTHLKEDAFRAELAAARRRCARWFPDHFPGVFSAEGPDALPDILMLTTQTTTPHEKQPRQSAMAPNWLWIAGLENDWDVLTSEHLPGWRLALRGLRNTARPWEIILSAREPDVADAETLKPYGGGGDYALDAYMSDRIYGLAARFGCLALAAAYHRRLASQRDLPVAERATLHRAIGRLENARSRAADTTFDALQVAEDLHAYGNSPRFGFDVYDFDLPLADFQEDRFPDGLVHAWGDTLDRSVERLRSTQRAVEASLTVDSSLTGAIANLRTQRNVIVLTVILLLLSVVTATVQIMRLNDAEPTRDATAATSEGT